MVSTTLSSKGQIILPAAIRRLMGLMAGSQLEIIEEPDGIRLVPFHPVKFAFMASCAGMVTAPTTGSPGCLADFDAANMTVRPVTK